MTEWISIESDWAYFVNPNTFEMPNAKGNALVGSLVLEKSKETIDTGQTFVVTQYSIAESHGLRNLPSKREASEYLAKQMFTFMREHNSYPPATSIKKTYKNGNVDLLYEASQYDQFTIRLTPKMVGGDVEEFLDILTKGGRLPFIPTDSWKIEPAKSSRAICKTCGSGISKGTLRVGEPSYFQDHLSYKWHHFECIADDIWKIPVEMLDGFDELDYSLKEIVRKRLWS
jgi:hypothetical protein